MKSCGIRAEHLHRHSKMWNFIRTDMNSSSLFVDEFSLFDQASRSRVRSRIVPISRVLSAEVPGTERPTRPTRNAIIFLLSDQIPDPPRSSRWEPLPTLHSLGKSSSTCHVKSDCVLSTSVVIDPVLLACVNTDLFYFFHRISILRHSSPTVSRSTNPTKFRGLPARTDFLRRLPCERKSPLH